MNRPTDAMRPRGSTLLLAMILLGVLSVIGVAAVTLSSQERTNASTMTRRDQLLACAAAAQASMWAEIVQNGPSYFKSGLPIPVVKLPDGTTLQGGHYDSTDTTLVDTSYKPTPCVPSGSSATLYVDLTNRDAFFNAAGSCSIVTAHCIDPQGRQLEVEFSINVLFQK